MVAQNSKVRMSRYMDTSSTTLVAQIVVDHWRCSGSSWTKFVWSPTRRPPVGETFWKSTELGMSICSSKTWNILVGKRGRYHYGWKKSRIWVPRGRKLKLVDLGEPTSFRDHVYLGCTRTKISLRKTTRCSNHGSLLEQLKHYMGGRKRHAKTVAWWYARSCDEMRGKRLRTDEQERLRLLHVSTTHSAKRKNWKRLEIF